VPIGPSTCAKPFENAWPSAFVSGPDNGLVSATRDEHGREAQPQANRAAAGEAAATGQHRLNETPEEKEEPDGGDAEPAEDNRVHALMKQEEGGERGARPAEFNRPTNRTLMQH